MGSLRAVVARLRAIPMPLREFTATEEHAYRIHGLTEDILTAAIESGLPRVESGRSHYFDNHDLANVSATVRGRSAWALGQRGWLAGLANLRAGQQMSYELTIAAKCPFPGHRGPCDFAYLLADSADPAEPADSATGELVSPDTLRVHTGTGTIPAPDHVRNVLACLDDAHYLHLPAALQHDLGFYQRTGLANCMLAADVLLRQARLLGVRARRSSGLALLPPYAGLHTWIDFWVDRRWVAFDPHLIRLLHDAGVLPEGHWPAHDSLSGLLLRLAPTNTPLVRHNGVHCTASFRLARTS